MLKLFINEFLTTLPDYCLDIEKRIKEDLISRGLYNPNQPLTLEQINQKWVSSGPVGNHIKNWWTNQTDRNLLLVQMNKEDFDFFWLFCKSSDEMSKIGDEDFVALTKESFNKSDYETMNFILESLIKVVETATEKAKKKKKKKRFAQLSYPYW